MAQSDYDEAIEVLIPLINYFENTADPSQAAEAMFWMAFCHEKEKRIDQARSLYTLIEHKYPDAPASRQAAHRLARIEARSRH